MRGKASVSVIALASLLTVFVGAPASAAIKTKTFTKTETITIPSSGVANPSPSVLSVGGKFRDAKILDVNVQINDFSHTFPEDVSILLVAPNGRSVQLMSHCGGSLDIVNVDLTFDQAAGSFLPDSTQIVSGTFKPTDFQGTFVVIDENTEAANQRHHTLDVFNGGRAGGKWKLYVRDNSGGDTGTILQWSLIIQAKVR